MEKFNAYLIGLPLLGVFGLVFTFWIYLSLKKCSEGSDKMRELAAAIREGAMVFLKREYSILIVFVIIVAIMLAMTKSIGVQTAGAFIFGALSSMLAGF